MSFLKGNRKFRVKSGNDFRDDASDLSFIEAMAKALRLEFGTTPSRIKAVARLTGCNERTVKNWFCARNGPNGESLVELMRHSSEVLKLVLQRAGHPDLVNAIQVQNVREQLRCAIETLNEILGAHDDDKTIQD